MSSPSLERAREVWDGLSDEQRYSLARSVARRRVGEWKRTLRGVVSVGVGFRTRDGKNDPIRDEICLRFGVKRKKERIRKGRVPDFVHAYVEVDGERRRCAIPTDVDVLAPGETNSNFGLRRGIIVREDGAASGDLGAVCAVVADVDDNWYLLSCNHVLALPKDGGCSPTFLTDVFRARGKNRTAAQKIGDLFEAKPLTPGSGFGLDAALAFVTKKNLITPTVQGKRPKQVADENAVPGNYKIYSPRGPLPADFVGEQFDYSVPFGCGADVRLEHVIMSNAATVKGDSGSPLLSPDGTLWGMHFYLTAADSTNPSYALAIPAYILFREGLWPVEIELATT